MVAPIYIPTNSVLWFLFLHTPSNICYCVLFDDSHSDMCEVISYCDFDLISLMITNIKHIFMSLLAICMSYVEKCLFRSSANLGCLLFFFHVQLYKLFIYLDINPLSVISFANIFSHSVGCLFILSLVSFAVQRLLSLIKPYLFLLLFCLRKLIQENIIKIYVKECYA